MKKPTLTQFIANDLVDTESAENWERENVAEILLTTLQDAKLPFEFDDFEYFLLMDKLDKILKEDFDIDSAVKAEVKEREDNYREYVEARDEYLKG